MKKLVANPYHTALQSGRLVHIRGDINGEQLDTFRTATAGLLKDSQEAICIVLTTHGGNPDYGWPLFDEVRELSSVVSLTMVASGPIYSFGMYLMLSLPVADRYAMPHATFYIHRARQSYKREGSGYGENQAYNILEDTANLTAFRNTQRQLDQLLVKETGLTHKEALRARDNPAQMSPKKAKKLGLIGHILP